MKNKVLGIGLAITIGFTSLFSTMLDINALQELENHWGKDDVIYLLDNKIITGYEDGTFKHNRSVTRAEFLKMVNNIYDIEATGTYYFSDVNKNDWYYDDINKAVAAGLIFGYDDTTMKPNNPITRQEASKIISVASELDPKGPKDIKEFEDAHEIDDWAKEHIDILVSHGYISGYDDGTFKPKNNLTRVESAKILAGIFREKQEDERNKVEEEMESEIDDFLELDLDEEEKEESLIDKNDTETTKPDKDKNDTETTKPDKDKNDTETTKPDKDKNDAEITKPDKDKDENNTETIKPDKEEEKLSNNFIVSKSKSNIKQAQAWAKSKGAHKRFIDIAPTYWYYGELTGINPEVLYTQAAKETNFGRYTGSVKPEMNNWAGIKTDSPTGDDTYDHEIFETPEDGVRAHFNHVGIYVGIDPIGEPHPRWYITSTVPWAGTIKTVEQFSEKWAPSPDYGYSIVRDYMKPLYDTKY